MPRSCLLFATLLTATLFAVGGLPRAEGAVFGIQPQQNNKASPKHVEQAFRSFDRKLLQGEQPHGCLIAGTPWDAPSRGMSDMPRNPEPLGGMHSCSKFWHLAAEVSQSGLLKSLDVIPADQFFVKESIRPPIVHL